jgi:hypothetical protein
MVCSDCPVSPDCGSAAPSWDEDALGVLRGDEELSSAALSLLAVSPAPGVAGRIFSV